MLVIHVEFYRAIYMVDICVKLGITGPYLVAVLAGVLYYLALCHQRVCVGTNKNRKRHHEVANSIDAYS